MPLERIHDVIAVFPLDGQGSDADLAVPRTRPAMRRRSRRRASWTNW